MKKMTCLLFIAASMASLVVCGPKKITEDVSLRDDGLDIDLTISADREVPNRINGKLRIVNSSADMLKYGNFQLFLGADNQEAVTTVKTTKANAMADQRLLHLSPGDTLHFIAHWDYADKVDFQNAAFKLRYDNSITGPEVQS
jgi:hypothetical protein